MSFFVPRISSNISRASAPSASICCSSLAAALAIFSKCRAWRRIRELMDRRVTADEGAAADGLLDGHNGVRVEIDAIEGIADVPTEHGVVRKGDVIANVAIMLDVGTDHEEAAFADPCNPAAGFGADIHGNAFAYLAACADNELGRLAAIVDRDPSSNKQSTITAPCARN